MSLQYSSTIPVLYTGLTNTVEQEQYTKLPAHTADPQVTSVRISRGMSATAGCTTTQHSHLHSRRMQTLPPGQTWLARARTATSITPLCAAAGRQRWLLWCCAKPDRAVVACRPISKAEVSNEMESFTTWIRMTRVDLIGLLIFLIYILTGGAYILARIVYSLDGLGSELWYGAIVLSAEILSILSLIFYGIWLCAKTNNDDMKVKSFDSDKMRRLYVVRVFILCKGESLSLVRRTIASVRNAYMPDGCELKLYLLDEARDNSKRDFFMGVKNGTDVIYVTPPVKSGDSKVSPAHSPLRTATA